MSIPSSRRVTHMKSQSKNYIFKTQMESRCLMRFQRGATDTGFLFELLLLFPSLGNMTFCQLGFLGNLHQPLFFFLGQPVI